MTFITFVVFFVKFSGFVLKRYLQLKFASLKTRLLTAVTLFILNSPAFLGKVRVIYTHNLSLYTYTYTLYFTLYTFKNHLYKAG